MWVDQMSDVMSSHICTSTIKPRSPGWDSSAQVASLYFILLSPRRLHPTPFNFDTLYDNMQLITSLYIASAVLCASVSLAAPSFRLDRQSTPSSGSGLVANVQLQKNGVSGISTVAGVLLQGVPIPPLTVGDFNINDMYILTLINATG